MPPHDVHRARVDALFAEALELPDAERAVFLRHATADDSSLRLEVDELLRLAAQPTPNLAPDALVGSSLWEDLAAPTLPEIATLAADRVGAWRLVSELGSGGMGTVWLAERADGQYEQKAALKLLQPGLQADALVRRFEQERQILASLDHPHIARLLDGGLADDGRPWFAMEYVDGEPIDVFCDARTLSVEARLRLFIQVARAVQAAHGSLVVHRDLKPSNILVTREGYPRLLDFGIAKPLDARADAQAVTRTLLVLTPEYASPEQVRGQPTSVASDIYQLGLLLYELLSGQRAQRLERCSPAELERVVCERMPASPSAAATQGGGAAASARARRTTPAGLRRALRGDLDAIVMRALRKAPERRYGIAAELVDDVERYLRGHPVRARPETLGYRASKFVRRHPVGVAAGIAFALLLIAYTATVTQQARQLARERDQVRIEARRTEEVKDFLVGLFEVSDPDQARGATVSARDLLDQGWERIREELASEPAVQSELIATIGEIYRRLGLYERAEPLLDEALQMRRRLYGETHPLVAESLHARATLDADQGEYKMAESRYREALAMRRQVLGAQDPLVAETLSSLLVPLRAQLRHSEAEPLAREALEIYRKAYPADDPRIASALNNLAMLHHYRRDLDAAEPLYREALKIHRSRHGEVHTQVASTLNNLAVLDSSRGRFEEAEDLLRRVLKIEQRLYPDGHPETAVTLAYLGHALRDQGDLAGAEGAYREAVELLRRTLPVGHPNTAGAMGVLGDFLVARGRPAEAEPLLRQSFRGRRAAFGPDHAKTLASQISLGACLLATDRNGEGVALLQEAAERATKVLGENHELSTRARSMLAAATAPQRRG